MSWDPHTLARINGEDGIHLSSRRHDGSLRPFITMWMGVARAVTVRIEPA